MSVRASPLSENELSLAMQDQVKFRVFHFQIISHIKNLVGGLWDEVLDDFRRLCSELQILRF